MQWDLYRSGDKTAMQWLKKFAWLCDGLSVLIKQLPIFLLYFYNIYIFVFYIVFRILYCDYDLIVLCGMFIRFRIASVTSQHLCIDVEKIINKITNFLHYVFCLL